MDFELSLDWTSEAKVKYPSAKKRISEANQMRKEFDQFIDNIKLSSNYKTEMIFNEILQRLRIEFQGIYELDHLSRAFGTLLIKKSNKRRFESINWTEVETGYLISVVAYYCNSFGQEIHSLGEKDWCYLEKIFPTKKANQLRKRWNTVLKVDLTQSAWRTEEDNLLRTLVAKYGSERQWKTISEILNSTVKNGVFRHSRQCRERWVNYIDPKVNKGKWSSEDDLKLMTSFLKLGKKWACIAKILGNRSENSVRNRFNSLIKKRRLQHKSLDNNLSQNDETFEIQLARDYVQKGTVSGLSSMQTGLEEAQQSPKKAIFDTNNETSTITTESAHEYDSPRTDSWCYKQAPFMNDYRNSGENQAAYQYSQGVICKDTHNSCVFPSYYTHSMANNIPLIPQNWSFSVRNWQYELRSSELNSVHSFRLSSGNTGIEEFSKEVTRAGSQVFFAMVDIQSNEIQIIEKVSKNTFPKYFENNFEDRLAPIRSNTCSDPLRFIDYSGN